MILEYTHKIGERLVLVREQTSGLNVQIMRVSDGKFFNRGVVPPSFTDYVPPAQTGISGTAYITNGALTLNGVGSSFDTEVNAGDILRITADSHTELVIVASVDSATQITLAASYQGTTISQANAVTIYFGSTPLFTNMDYTYNFSDLYSQNVGELTITDLPKDRQDLLFIYEDDGVISYERHFFGGKLSTNEPSTCLVYGTLKDVSGRPLEGQKVEAYLNRAGFFTHKAGLIGYASTALTDESGYFELPLIVGLDVTINVPIIGFTQRGYVPSVSMVELTTQSLLSYNPG